MVTTSYAEVKGKVLAGRMHVLAIDYATTDTSP